MMAIRYLTLCVLFSFSFTGHSQQNILIEYFQVPTSDEQKYRVMQNSIAREHHQNLLDYQEIDAWYHYQNKSEGEKEYNYAVITLFPHKEAFENRNALLHFEDFLVKRAWYEARPIIQSGMDQAPEGVTALVEFLDMTSDIGTLEAFLSRNYKSDLNRKVENNELEGYGLYMSSDARFKAEQPYLLISFTARKNEYPVGLNPETEQNAFEYKGNDRWKLMYAVTRD